MIKDKQHQQAQQYYPTTQSETAVLPEREDHAQGSVVNITVSNNFFWGWNGHAVKDGVNGRLLMVHSPLSGL